MKPALGKTDWLFIPVSGLLLAVSFPPWNLYPCIFIALIPLFWRLDPGETVNNAWRGFLGGLCFYGPLLYWLYLTTVGGILLLVLFLSLLMAAFASIVGRLKKYPYWIPLAALVVSIIEYFRSIGLFSFAWGYLGHSFYLADSLKQPVYWIGVPGLSFVIAGLNASLAVFLYTGWHHWKTDRSFNFIDRRSHAHWFTLLFSGLLLTFFLYGQTVIGKITDPAQKTIPFKIALIQGGYSQDEKESTDNDDTLQRYLALSHKAVKDKPDLIVWPESAITVPIDYWHEGIQQILSFIRTNDVEMLVGTVCAEYDRGKWTYWNKAILFTPDISLDLTGTVVNVTALQSYSKMHLVPFGEWVPWVEYWPFSTIETLIEEAGAGIFQPGTKRTLFQTRKGVTFAVAICFESTLAAPFREAKTMGADFFVNVTNDAWFRDSPGLEQHFSHCAFRAAENRTYVARAANTGITGIFTPAGAIETSIPPNESGVCIGELLLPIKN